ncbi:unannotated protein [freshwater metagenome]|uniref:Unannotated protein n=1 Tax=freshwater metagenome TaxID=449393 RepID=A0A6J6TV57_9ZZZZ
MHDPLPLIFYRPVGNLDASLNGLVERTEETHGVNTILPQGNPRSDLPDLG